MEMNRCMMEAVEKVILLPSDAAFPIEFSDMNAIVCTFVKASNLLVFLLYIHIVDVGRRQRGQVPEPKPTGSKMTSHGGPVTPGPFSESRSAPAVSCGGVVCSPPTRRNVSAVTSRRLHRRPSQSSSCRVSTPCCVSVSTRWPCDVNPRLGKRASILTRDKLPAGKGGCGSVRACVS
ncbi:unnamed protein product [Boreogadus saida]